MREFERSRETIDRLRVSSAETKRLVGESQFELRKQLKAFEREGFNKRYIDQDLQIAHEHFTKAQSIMGFINKENPKLADLMKANPHLPTLMEGYTA
jgi:hypothetical protein